MWLLASADMETFVLMSIVLTTLLLLLLGSERAATTPGLYTVKKLLPVVAVGGPNVFLVVQSSPTNQTE